MALSELLKSRKAEFEESGFLCKWINRIDEGIIAIIGDIRSGKTALAFRLMQLNETKKHKMVLLPDDSLVDNARKVFSKIIPELEVITRLSELKNESVLLVDEAAIQTSARRSMSNTNLLHQQLAVLAGQKKVIALYLTQASRLLDVTQILMSRDLVFKRIPWFADIFERKELLQLFSYFFGYKIRKLKKLKHNEGYIVGRDFPVPRYFRNKLPYGWTEEASRFMKNYVLIEKESALEDEEDKLKLEQELDRKIIELRGKGLSYRRIAETLGITEWRVRKALGAIPGLRA